MYSSNLINKIKSSDIFETLRHSKNYFSAYVANNALGFFIIRNIYEIFNRSHNKY